MDSEESNGNQEQHGGEQKREEEQKQENWVIQMNEYLIAALIGLPQQDVASLVHQTQPPLPPLPSLPSLPSFLSIGSPVYPPILPVFPVPASSLPSSLPSSTAPSLLPDSVALLFPPPPSSASSSASSPSLPPLSASLSAPLSAPRSPPLSPPSFILRIPPLVLPPPREDLTGKIHYLEDKERESQGPAKRSPTRLVRKRILGYRYLSLRSGKTFTFSDNDGKNILLPTTAEPNLYVRKLLSRLLPLTLQARLLFLADMESEEGNEVVAMDARESDEWILPSYQITLSNLFTNLREQLYTAYLQEMRLRRVFRSLAQRWRIRRIHRKEVISTDPITLAEPKKPIELYDLHARTRYQFDASSLATWIESNLTYSEGGFSVPMNPRNPWTNQEFTYYQLITIYNQLKFHGELRWAFTTYRKFDFHRSKWQLYHSSALSMSAIRAGLLQLDSYDSRELLEDFIATKMEDLHQAPTQRVLRVYQRAMIREPQHWYLQEWKAVAFLHYEADHFRQNKNRLIHNRCDRILRKQDQFFEEMEAIGISLD